MAVDYNGLVENWKVAFIRARIRRFPADEAQDLEQELVLKVRRFRFDAARSNGASEKTVLRRVVNRHLATRARCDRRRRRLLADYQRYTGCPHASMDVVLLRLDVRLALAALTPHERVVCGRLGLGQSRRHIAALPGCSDRKVRRTLERLRRRFHVMGLDGWLEDSGT